MVQAIENLTQISGEVVARRPHPSLDSYDVITLKLEAAEAVEGKANLLGSLVGGTVDVTVRKSLLASAAPGQRLRCRAKRTPDGAMCESQPAAGSFEIL